MSQLAIITGASGQDGSYLAEYLISLGYKVIGVVRRTSTHNYWRLKNVLNSPSFILDEGDVTDPSYLFNLLNKYKPDEFYNLAAQSHVYTSFFQPSLTWSSVALGTLNCLEAIRILSPKTKFYQASSSEMFGDRIEHNGQKENTGFNPQSPYAIAKLAAHHSTELYRKSYNIYACSGILFNHETLSYGTPLIIKVNNTIDILPIGDIARFKTGVIFNMNKKEYQEGKPINNLKVWDKNGWVDISWVSGYPHKGDKNPRIINARNFVYTATGNHPCIMENNSEKNTSDLNIGDKVKLIEYPNIDKYENISLEEAEWLGMLVGDGNLHHKTPRFTNKDLKIKQKFADLWMSFVNNGSYKFTDSVSGFNKEYIGQVICNGKYDYDYDIYTNDISPFGHKNKKVPFRILNASKDIMEAFLVGYNKCDGLKSNKCKYRFQNFKTNSATLAAGLLFLVSKVTGQKYNITVEESWKFGKQQFYYSINLLSDSESPSIKYDKVNKLLNQNMPQRQIHKITGISRSFIKKVKGGYQPNLTHHLELCNNEIKKIINIPNYNGWFFDLETSSGTFHAGVGQGVVHNSPRRGDNFVTKKITNYLKGEIKYKLELGNLDAYRDWSHAKDMVRGMHLMMQQPESDTYAIGSGKSYSVKNFLEIAFSKKNLNWEDYVIINENLKRPSEVPYLRCLSTKLNNLGWKQDFTFDMLVEDMLYNEI